MAKLGDCNMKNGNGNGNGKCCVNDQVCLTVELGDLVDEQPFEFWNNSSGISVNGTVVVKNNELDDDIGTPVELIVNGADPDSVTFTIEPGDTKSFTLSNLLSLALEAEGGTGDNPETTAQISFSLNYKF